MRIHILAGAGAMTTPLAIELQKQGNIVSISEQANIYPPYSTLIKKYKIPVNTTEINRQLDLVIVGSAYRHLKRTREDFNQVKKLKIPHISATQFVAKQLSSHNSIIVAGSFGKSTITALLAQILTKAGLNPSYYFGGQSIKPFPSLNFAPASYSIVEGDESVNGLDTKAKFLYYPVKYLILTSALWEHKESYSTAAKNTKAFSQLINHLPPDGLLIYNHQQTEVVKLSQSFKYKKISYGGHQADYSLQKIISGNRLNHLTIRGPNSVFTLNTQLFGQFNFDNILAATVMAVNLGISLDKIKNTIREFTGLKRRLELKAKINQIYFYDDFAQSPERIKSSLLAITHKYPQKKVKVFYEPHASFVYHPHNLDELKQALSLSKTVIMSRLNYRRQFKKRLTAADFRRHLDKKIIYLPLFEDIFAYFINNLQPGDILIHFSSGGLTGLKTLNHIITHYQNTS